MSNTLFLLGVWALISIPFALVVSRAMRAGDFGPRRETADEIYAREVEAAKRRHPAYRTERGTYF